MWINLVIPNQSKLHKASQSHRDIGEVSRTQALFRRTWRICQVDEARPQIRRPTHSQEGAHAHLSTVLVVMMVVS